MSANNRYRQIEKLVLDVFRSGINNISWATIVREKDNRRICFCNGAELASITITDTDADWCAIFASVTSVTDGLLQENGDFIFLESGDLILQET